jgi:galactokinase
MDQMASACGGFVFIDFRDEGSPEVEKIDFDFADCGYTLCILNSKGSHASLTDQYASIPAEMFTVAKALGKDYLREVDPQEFYDSIGRIRGEVSDRAIMRAMHFFDDDMRAVMEKDALKASDINGFLRLINESGASSQQVLENVSPEDPANRSLAFSIAYAKHLLNGKGACRVQGGGFAGTAEAFVPDDEVEEFSRRFTEVFGENSVLISGIRRYGAVEIER